MENDVFSSDSNNSSNIDDLNPINDMDSIYITEISYKRGVRTIKITAFKNIYVILFILLIIQILDTVTAFTILREILFLKILFLFAITPFILFFLFLPINGICKYDYIHNTFTSYATSIIPIPCKCFYNKIYFQDINFFYLFKIQKFNKKYFKIGINSADGRDREIITGAIYNTSSYYKTQLSKIPSVLKYFLKE